MHLRAHFMGAKQIFTQTHTARVWMSVGARCTWGYPSGMSCPAMSWCSSWPPWPQGALWHVTFCVPVYVRVYVAALLSWALNCLYMQQTTPDDTKEKEAGYKSAYLLDKNNKGSNKPCEEQQQELGDKKHDLWIRQEIRTWKSVL